MDEVITVIIESEAGGPDALVYKADLAGFRRAEKYAALFNKQGRLIRGPEYRCVLSDERNG